MKGLALIIGSKLKGKGPSPSSDEEEEGAPDSEASEEDYGKMLADIVGVSEDDRSDFVDALRGFVKNCVRKTEKDEY